MHSRLLVTECNCCLLWYGHQPPSPAGLTSLGSAHTYLASPAAYSTFFLPSTTTTNHHSKILRAATMPVPLGATLAEIEEAFAHQGGVQIAQTDLVGEETLTRFDSTIWFAVQVGDVLEDRYKVLGKVANGGSSTIWFVRDEQ
jgi:hypothetical protein